MSRQYITAAKAVEAVVINKKSFNSYCASQKIIGKTDFALAAETLKYKDVLHTICQRIQITPQSLDVGHGMMLVLMYELLFGKGKIDGGGVVKRRLMEVKDQMMEALRFEMEKKGAEKHADLLSTEVLQASQMKKYVRMNELKITDLSDCFLTVQQIIPSALMDDLIPALIVLPPDRSLGQHAWVKEGKLIIQDKASCFPSKCLYDEWACMSDDNKKGDVIDCCAAPGNKTSHLAAQMSKHQGNHQIFAFDKDTKRAALLTRRMKEAGADHIVNVSNDDFLSIDVSNQRYAKVTSVLLDPSCSGSGVSRALERVIAMGSPQDEEKERDNEQRLEQLRQFQIQALKKAMSFPAAIHVVYSTCSINIEENESVVAEVLSAVNQGVPSGLDGGVNGDNSSSSSSSKKRNGSRSNSSKSIGSRSSDNQATKSEWKLVAPSSFDNWKRRGIPCPGLTETQQKCLLRCHPSDGLNGFFVAVFNKQVGTTSNNDINVATQKIPSTMHGFKPVDGINHLRVFPTTKTTTPTSTNTSAGSLKRKREIYVDSNSLPHPVVWKRKKPFWKPFHHLQCL